MFPWKSVWPVVLGLAWGVWLKQRQVIRGFARKARFLIQKRLYGDVMDLEVCIGKLRLKNPVMTASGTFGYGEEYAEFVDLNRLGAVVVKGLSLMPKEGNPTPRIIETPSGMLNSIGLQNIGIDRFIKEKVPFLKQFNTSVIVNFFGDSIEEYASA